MSAITETTSYCFHLEASIAKSDTAMGSLPDSTFLAAASWFRACLPCSPTSSQTSSHEWLIMTFLNSGDESSNSPQGQIDQHRHGAGGGGSCECPQGATNRVV